MNLDDLIPDSVIVKTFNAKAGTNMATVEQIIDYLDDHPEKRAAMLRQLTPQQTKRMLGFIDRRRAKR